MDIHKNARLTPKSRAEVARRIARGESKSEVARAFGICAKTAAKWFERHRQEGEAGLMDRSSRPRRLRCPTRSEVVEEVLGQRRQRRPGREIAARTGVSAATVSRILKRAGLSRMKDLDPPPPILRYERQLPGEMIHIDIKKLGRIDGIGHRITGERRGQSNLRARGQGPGWEFAHVAIDDNSRIAFSQIRKDERQDSAIVFLKAAVASSEQSHVPFGNWHFCAASGASMPCRRISRFPIQNVSASMMLMTGPEALPHGFCWPRWSAPE